MLNPFLLNIILIFFSPRKIGPDKKKQTKAEKADKKPPTNINKKPRSMSDSSKKDAPTYLKPTENQKNRVSDDTETRGWDTHLRDGKISEFHPLSPTSERKINEGFAGAETPGYAKATKNLVNKQNDSGEYEHKDWSKNFRSTEDVSGGKDTGGKGGKKEKKKTTKENGIAKENKVANKKKGKNLQNEKELDSDRSNEVKNKIKENGNEETLNNDHNNTNNNNESESENPEAYRKSENNNTITNDSTLQQQPAQQETDRRNSEANTNDADSESSPRKSDKRTLSFGGEESIYFSDDSNNNDGVILPSPTQSEEELAVLFGEKRSRVCSFYDSPTSGEDEVLYDGYDQYLNEDDDTGNNSRESHTKSRKTAETARKNEENVRKSDEKAKSTTENIKEKSNNKKATGQAQSKKITKKTTTKASDDLSTKQATSTTTTKTKQNDKQPKINKGKPTTTKNKGVPTKQISDTEAKTKTTPEGANTNRKNNKKGIPTKSKLNKAAKPTTTISNVQKTPHNLATATIMATPRKRLSQRDGKSESEAPAAAPESKHNFCDVAVIVDDHKDATQKADQMCEYIKRRGRVFVTQQPHSTSKNKDESKAQKSKMTEANQEFKRMLKQAKIVLVIISETLKTNQAALEFCAYADRLNKPVYPLLLEGKKMRYEPSCLLDLMIGNKYHYEVGVHYEQEMGKILEMIKNKIKT